MLWFVAPFTPTAFAEGSADLIRSGVGMRASLLSVDFATDLAPPSDAGSVALHYAYVEPGETLLLASSANGVGEGRIEVLTPSGAVLGCPTTVGHIANITQERAGPLALLGYEPCAFDVGEGEQGLWRIEFRAPQVGYRFYDYRPTEALEAWDEQHADDFFVTAWDATVVRTGANGSPQPIKGRLFSPGFIGMVDHETQGDSPWYATFHVKTVEGYAYVLETNGLDPMAFSFFSSTHGIIENEPIVVGAKLPEYISVPTDKVGEAFTFDNPLLPENDFSSNRLYYNTPDPSMPAEARWLDGQETWLNPARPDVQILIRSDVSENSTHVELSLQGDRAPNYSRLVLDLNANGRHDPDEPFQEVNNLQPGANQVPLDVLRDYHAQGGLIPEASRLLVRFTSLQGRVHFPLSDAEFHKHGFRLYREWRDREPARLFWNPTEENLGPLGLMPDQIITWDREIGNERVLNLWATASGEQKVSTPIMRGPMSPVGDLSLSLEFDGFANRDLTGKIGQLVTQGQPMTLNSRVIMTVTNDGDAPVSGIDIALEGLNGATVQNPPAELADFRARAETLLPGETQSIVFEIAQPVVRPLENQAIVATQADAPRLYAQVLAMDVVDLDSVPGNGSVDDLDVANLEDDEDIVFLPQILTNAEVTEQSRQGNVATATIAYTIVNASAETLEGVEIQDQSAMLLGNDYRGGSEQPRLGSAHTAQDRTFSVKTGPAGQVIGGLVIHPGETVEVLVDVRYAIQAPANATAPVPSLTTAVIVDKFNLLAPTELTAFEPVELPVFAPQVDLDVTSRVLGMAPASLDGVPVGGTVLGQTRTLVEVTVTNTSALAAEDVGLSIALQGGAEIANSPQNLADFAERVKSLAPGEAERIVLEIVQPVEDVAQTGGEVPQMLVQLGSSASEDEDSTVGNASFDILGHRNLEDDEALEGLPRVAISSSIVGVEQTAESSKATLSIVVENRGSVPLSDIQIQDQSRQVLGDAFLRYGARVNLGERHSAADRNIASHINAQGLQLSGLALAPGETAEVLIDVLYGAPADWALDHPDFETKATVAGRLQAGALAPIGETTTMVLPVLAPTTDLSLTAQLLGVQSPVGGASVDVDALVSSVEVTLSNGGTFPVEGVEVALSATGQARVIRGWRADIGLVELPSALQPGQSASVVLDVATPLVQSLAGDPADGRPAEPALMIQIANASLADPDSVVANAQFTSLNDQTLEDDEVVVPLPQVAMAARLKDMRSEDNDVVATLSYRMHNWARAPLRDFALQDLSYEGFADSFVGFGDSIGFGPDHTTPDRHVQTTTNSQGMLIDALRIEPGESAELDFEIQYMNPPAAQPGTQGFAARADAMIAVADEERSAIASYRPIHLPIFKVKAELQAVGITDDSMVAAVGLSIENLGLAPVQDSRIVDLRIVQDPSRLRGIAIMPEPVDFYGSTAAAGLSELAKSLDFVPVNEVDFGAIAKLSESEQQILLLYEAGPTPQLAGQAQLLFGLDDGQERQITQDFNTLPLASYELALLGPTYEQLDQMTKACWTYQLTNNGLLPISNVELMDQAKHILGGSLRSVGREALAKVAAERGLDITETADGLSILVPTLAPGQSIDIPLCVYYQAVEPFDAGEVLPSRESHRIEGRLSFDVGSAEPDGPVRRIAGAPVSADLLDLQITSRIVGYEQEDDLLTAIIENEVINNGKVAAERLTIQDRSRDVFGQDFHGYILPPVAATGNTANLSAMQAVETGSGLEIRGISVQPGQRAVIQTKTVFRGVNGEDTPHADLNVARTLSINLDELSMLSDIPFPKMALPSFSIQGQLGDFTIDDDGTSTAVVRYAIVNKGQVALEDLGFSALVAGEGYEELELTGTIRVPVADLSRQPTEQVLTLEPGGGVVYDDRGLSVLEQRQFEVSATYGDVHNPSLATRSLGAIAVQGGGPDFQKAFEFAPVDLPSFRFEREASSIVVNGDVARVSIDYVLTNDGQVPLYNLTLMDLSGEALEGAFLGYVNAVGERLADPMAVGGFAVPIAVLAPGQITRRSVHFEYRIFDDADPDPMASAPPVDLAQAKAQTTVSVQVAVAEGAPTDHGVTTQGRPLSKPTSPPLQVTPLPMLERQVRLLATESVEGATAVTIEYRVANVGQVVLQDLSVRDFTVQNLGRNFIRLGQTGMVLGAEHRVSGPNGQLALSSDGELRLGNWTLAPGDLLAVEVQLVYSPSLQFAPNHQRPSWAGATQGDAGEGQVFSEGLPDVPASIVLTPDEIMLQPEMVGDQSLSMLGLEPAQRAELNDTPSNHQVMMTNLAVSESSRTALGIVEAPLSSMILVEEPVGETTGPIEQNAIWRTRTLSEATAQIEGRASLLPLAFDFPSAPLPALLVEVQISAVPAAGLDDNQRYVKIEFDVTNIGSVPVEKIAIMGWFDQRIADVDSVTLAGTSGFAPASHARLADDPMAIFNDGGILLDALAGGLEPGHQASVTLDAVIAMEPGVQDQDFDDWLAIQAEGVLSNGELSATIPLLANKMEAPGLDPNDFFAFDIGLGEKPFIGIEVDCYDEQTRQGRLFLKDKDELSQDGDLIECVLNGAFSVGPPDPVTDIVVSVEDERPANAMLPVPGEIRRLIDQLDRRKEKIAPRKGLLVSLEARIEPLCVADPLEYTLTLENPLSVPFRDVRLRGLLADTLDGARVQLFQKGEQIDIGAGDDAFLTDSFDIAPGEVVVLRVPTKVISEPKGPLIVSVFDLITPLYDDPVADTVVDSRRFWQGHSVTPSYVAGSGARQLSGSYILPAQ